MRRVENWVMLPVTLQASITVQSSVTVKYRYSEKCAPENTTWNQDIISTRNIKSNNEWNETSETLRGSWSLPQRWTLSVSRCVCVCVGTLLPDVLFPLELGFLQSSFEHWNRENTINESGQINYLMTTQNYIWQTLRMKGWFSILFLLQYFFLLSDCWKWFLRENKSLTVSHQHQGALGLGLAVVDLDGVSALVGSGEMIHRHLDDSCRHVVADLVSLRGRFVFRLQKRSWAFVCSSILL